jgi:translocator protein
LAVKKLLISLATCLGAGGVGAVFTTKSIGSWYVMLEKPFFTPPSWVFAPVWTVLYIMMGVAVYLVWNKGCQTGKYNLACLLFGIQLVLNIGWSTIFFGFRSIIGGLVVIGSLWLAIAGMIWQFSKVSRVAAWLLTPYLVWVSFAWVLNYCFWRLNK